MEFLLIYLLFHGAGMGSFTFGVWSISMWISNDIFLLQVGEVDLKDRHVCWYAYCRNWRKEEEVGSWNGGRYMMEMK